MLLLLGLAAWFGAWRLCLAIGWVDGHAFRSPRGTAFAVALAGLAFVVAGFKNLLAPPASPSGSASSADLLASARVHSRPCYVCTRCHEIFAARECPNGRCFECSSFEHCHEIETDEDLARLEAELTS